MSLVELILQGGVGRGSLRVDRLYIGSDERSPHPDNDSSPYGRPSRTPVLSLYPSPVVGRVVVENGGVLFVIFLFEVTDLRSLSTLCPYQDK